jgi:hypothetical protein
VNFGGKVVEGQDAPVLQPLSDVAKSSVGSYELPTGYIDGDGVLHTAVVVREITGEEEDILASRKMPMYVRMNKVIENCVLSIGTIKNGCPEWSKIIKDLIVTDRLFLLIKIRIVTLGELFSFKAQCPSEACGKYSSQTTSLEEFDIKGLKDPMLRSWKGKLPKSGSSYTARIQTGADEEKLAKVSGSEDLLSLAMLARLIELNGESPVTLSAVKRLSSMDRQFLRSDFEVHEGDIDNTVQVTCPHCGNEFSDEVSIASPSFFSLSAI